MVMKLTFSWDLTLTNLFLVIVHFAVVLIPNIVALHPIHKDGNGMVEGLIGSLNSIVFF